MDTIFGVLMLAAIVGLVYYLTVVQYKKTSYYKITGNPYAQAMFNIGVHGEYLTFMKLKSLEAQGARFLFNCYIQNQRGGTSELDVVMIDHSGIYVFESKNYSGWIFGNENSHSWTQCLPRGKGCSAQKEHFYNPIMQNRTHLKNLAAMLGQSCPPLYSVIVFSDRCTFKDLTCTDPNIHVIHRGAVRRTVSQIAGSSNCHLSDDMISQLYGLLYGSSQVSDTVKAQHIQDITAPKQCYTPQPTQITNENICPRCGSQLVIRTTKNGPNAGRQFYGCSSFPRCRYMRNL